MKSSLTLAEPKHFTLWLVEYDAKLQTRNASPWYFFFSYSAHYGLANCKELFLDISFNKLSGKLNI